MLDDEVVGKAGDGFLGGGKARGSSGDSHATERGSHGGGIHRGGCRVCVVARVVVASVLLDVTKVTFDVTSRKTAVL